MKIISFIRNHVESFCVSIIAKINMNMNEYVAPMSCTAIARRYGLSASLFQE
jgi:hypothetical protein